MLYRRYAAGIGMTLADYLSYMFSATDGVNVEHHKGTEDALKCRPSGRTLLAVSEVRPFDILSRVKRHIGLQKAFDGKERFNL